ncbi:MAG: hypothetical protein WCK89_10650 [bacterium]
MKTWMSVVVIAMTMMVSMAAADCGAAGCAKKAACKCEACGCTAAAKKADCKCDKCACGKPAPAACEKKDAAK